MWGIEASLPMAGKLRLALTISRKIFLTKKGILVPAYLEEKSFSQISDFTASEFLLLPIFFSFFFERDLKQVWKSFQLNLDIETLMKTFKVFLRFVTFKHLIDFSTL